MDKNKVIKAERALRNRINRRSQGMRVIENVDYLGHDENHLAFAVSYTNGAFDFFEVTIYDHSYRITNG